MATLLKVNGETATITPKNKKYFMGEELNNLVGGYIEIVTLPNGDYIVCDEEGKLKEKPINHNATVMWAIHFGMTDVLVGDVLICNKNEIR